MKQYVIGGAVRDVLLGLDPKDVDYVWVGASDHHMRSMGMQQVGAGFPVFLDSYGQEHALARTERKAGVGYTGFDVYFDSSTTLRDDQLRRDLTINQLAVDIDHWEQFKMTRSHQLVIDPHGGMADLRDGILRHTSDAFAEDPVRVLRTARFAARYGFTVHESTMELMRQVCGELIHVPMERVWTEIQKGLSEKHWMTMFHVMAAADVFTLPVPFRNFVQYDWYNQFRTALELTPVEKFALVSHGFTDQEFVNLTVPTEFSRFSKLFNNTVCEVQRYEELSAHEKIQLFEKMRVFNEWEGVTQSLILLNCIPQNAKFSPRQFILDCVTARQVDTASIASMYTSGLDIKNAIFDARVKAIS